MPRSFGSFAMLLAMRLASSIFSTFQTVGCRGSTEKDGKKTSAGGHSPDRGWLLLGGLKTKISLFERLSSHCLLVMKPGHAASQSNRNHDDDSESCQDTHISPPSVFLGVQHFWRAVCDALATDEIKLTMPHSHSWLGLEKRRRPQGD